MLYRVTWGQQSNGEPFSMKEEIKDYNATVALVDELLFTGKRGTTVTVEAL